MNPHNPPPFRVVVLPQERIEQIRAAIFKNGRMHAGDAGDAENGPDFWYDGHTLGELSAHRNWKPDHDRIVANNRRRVVYCMPAEEELARRQAKELDMVPPFQF